MLKGGHVFWCAVCKKHRRGWRLRNHLVSLLFIWSGLNTSSSLAAIKSCYTELFSLLSWSLATQWRTQILSTLCLLLWSMLEVDPTMDTMLALWKAITTGYFLMTKMWKWLMSLSCRHSLDPHRNILVILIMATSYSTRALAPATRADIWRISHFIRPSGNLWFDSCFLASHVY